MEEEWKIWYSQHIRWKWNDRYDTVNISDGSGMTYDTVNISDGSRMTDMIHSTYQMEVEWQIWYSQHITWKWNDRYGTLNISNGSGMTDMVQSTYQMEVEWQIWYSQHIRCVSYLSFHFHLICWMYYICHSTSMWYVECIISLIPLPSYMLTVSYVISLPSDMLTVSYLSFNFHVICWL
jgi:hypothetical protein